jgi:putative restriction endonuclease
MSRASPLEKYTTKFTKLRVDKNPTRYTLGKAPHKPILLLSLIILDKNNKIDLSNIETNIYLRETWSGLWELLEYNRVGPIHLPLYHMRSDGFWNIEFREEVTPHQPKSLNQFNNMVKSFSLEPDLIEFIKREDSRTQLINSLLNGGYFSDGEIQNLREWIQILDDSFKYEEKITSLIRKEFTMDYETSTELQPLRSSAFRRVVLTAYDETCSVCGMKIVTSSGISVIDAAHILPFSHFQNDDIRNGVALCKTHHWLFDKGLMSVAPHYRVIVSKTIEKEIPDKIVTNYSRNELILPNEPIKYPSQIAFDWHRENVLQK